MRTLDLRGMLLPFVLLKVSNVFKEMETGETLDIFLGDPEYMRDLLKILPSPSYEVTVMDEIQDEGTDFYVQLLKK